MAGTKNAGKTGNGKAAPQAATAPAEITLSLTLGAPERPGFQTELIAGGEMTLDGDTGAHLNVQVGPRGAAVFARYRNALRASEAKRPDGRQVWSNADALRYLLESMADAIEAAAAAVDQS
jgi:hypothetical protein